MNLQLFIPILLLILLILLYKKRAWFNIKNIKSKELEKVLSTYDNAKEAAASLDLSEKNFDLICFNLGYLSSWEEEMIFDAIQSSDNSKSAAKKLKTKKFIFETMCREYGITIPWKKS